MNLRKHILCNMKAYFNSHSNKSWIDRFESSRKNIDHDKQWLTLVSMFLLFDDQNHLADENISMAFNQVLQNSGFGVPIESDLLVRITLEKEVPEIRAYTNYLYELMTKGPFHLYPDICEIMEDRNLRRIKGHGQGASLDPKASIDCQIEFERQGRKKLLFIESKFLSDVNIQTTYNPVRNRIIEIIDAMIDQVNHSDLEFEDVYFALLTPKVFRISAYGLEKVTLLEAFNPRKSRVYCYMMADYKDYHQIKRDLPHRHLTDSEWQLIADRLGWLTYEDIYAYATQYKTYQDHIEEISTFFKKRNLMASNHTNDSKNL